MDLDLTVSAFDSRDFDYLNQEFGSEVQFNPWDDLARIGRVNEGPPEVQDDDWRFHGVSNEMDS
jgi:hypothetical protein